MTHKLTPRGFWKHGYLKCKRHCAQFTKKVKAKLRIEIKYQIYQSTEINGTRVNTAWFLKVPKGFCAQLKTNVKIGLGIKVNQKRTELSQINGTRINSSWFLKTRVPQTQSTLRSVHRKRKVNPRNFNVGLLSKRLRKQLLQYGTRDETTWYWEIQSDCSSLTAATSHAVLPLVHKHLKLAIEYVS